MAHRDITSVVPSSALCVGTSGVDVSVAPLSLRMSNTYKQVLWIGAQCNAIKCRSQLFQMSYGFPDTLMSPPLNQTSSPREATTSRMLDASPQPWTSYTYNSISIALFYTPIELRRRFASLEDKTTHDRNKVFHPSRSCLSSFRQLECHSPDNVRITLFAHQSRHALRWSIVRTQLRQRVRGGTPQCSRD